MARDLTTKAIEAAKPDRTKRIEIGDGNVRGLWLVVQPSGAKSWAFRYRMGQKPKKLTLGRYRDQTEGDVGGILQADLNAAHMPLLSLAEARNKAKGVQALVAAGKDPAATKAEAKAAANISEARRQDTVSVLVEQFDRRHLSQIKSGAQVRRFLDRFVVPNWGNRDVRAITKRDVLDLVEGISDAGKGVTANRVLAAVRKFLNWCVERDIIDRSPAFGVKPPAKEKSRDRVLSDDEIRWFWKATEIEGEPFGPLARTLLLTGQRLGEVGGMSDREIKGDEWHLPSERTKNARAHTVPLSQPVLDLLTGVTRIKGSGALVFTTTGETPVSGWDRVITRLRTSMAAIAMEEQRRQVMIEPWGFHDLRRTAATGMARLVVPVHVVEAVLNHRSGSVSGVAAVYNRFDYAAEKRRALRDWAQFVLELVEEPHSAKVPNAMGAR